MNLILTSYLTGDPEDVDDRIEASIETAVNAAGRRLGVRTPSASTDHVDRGVQVHTDIATLDGTTVEWAGQTGLTELRVVVPWRPFDDSRERTTLAAANFTAALTDRLQAA